MKYKIIDSEVKKTKTGKTFKICHIEGNDADISVWSDYSEYPKVEAGNEVEGVLRTKGEYTNLIDENPQYQRTSGAKEGLAIKSANIKEAQERSRESMTRLAIERDASNFTIALIPGLYKDLHEEELKMKRDEWRKYLDGKFTEPFI